MPLRAGAAQCDTDKGELVGSVTLVHGADGYVTVAPDQYYDDSPFDGSQVYVIAHAVVGLPDPDFGPQD